VPRPQPRYLRRCVLLRAHNGHSAIAHKCTTDQVMKDDVQPATKSLGNRPQSAGVMYYVIMFIMPEM